jgi:hypothetical protein
MPKRIQRKRTKGWRMPPNTIYVGRPGRFGNPFPMPHFERANFMAWLASDAPRAVAMMKAIPDLRGKNLACWCAPGKPCHADVLLEIANGGHCR